MKGLFYDSGWSHISLEPEDDYDDRWEDHVHEYGDGYAESPLRHMPLDYEDHLHELDAMELLFLDPTERRFRNMTRDPYGA